jgi:hypothetical protein
MRRAFEITLLTVFFSCFQEENDGGEEESHEGKPNEFRFRIDNDHVRQ